MLQNGGTSPSKSNNRAATKTALELTTNSYVKVNPIIHVSGKSNYSYGG